MFNDWFTIGPITIHGYGVMIAIGILVAFFFAERQARKGGLNVSVVDNLIFICLVSGYFFSKLTYVMINWDDFLANPMAVLGSSGWVVMGGILGGILGAYIYCKYKKVNFMEYFNLLIPGVSLAQAFGRVGCFFAGCCYGLVTTSKIGVTFPVDSLAPSGVKLLPTQLMSSAGNLAIFFILFYLYRQEKLRKYTSAAYLILYSIGRFMIEFLRGDIERGFIFGLATSQFISIFTFIAGIVLFYVIRNQDMKQEK